MVMTLEKYTNPRENTTQGYINMRIMWNKKKSHLILNSVYAFTTLLSSANYEHSQKAELRSGKDQKRCDY